MAVIVNGHSIAVDCWDSESTLNFVSHAHSDHISGIRKNKKVIASKITKELVEKRDPRKKNLGIDSESRYIGKGVSTCGTCDGPFFKNKNVIVVGGGDTAMEDANFITKFADTVTIVHRREEFKASKIMQEKVFSNKKIKIIWNSEVTEILGKDKVEAVKLRNIKSGEVQEMPIDGVFVAIGHSPNTKVFNGKLKLDAAGYIITKDEVLTDIEGVYIAGDVADKIYRQAVTASASGVKCALRAREYLTDLYYNAEKKNSE